MTLDELAQRIVTTQEEMDAKDDYALPDDYEFLVQREPPQPITNADRIRAMSDEEMAKYLAWLEDEQACYEWKLYGDAYRITEWLDWLKQEVEYGDSEL